MGNKKLTWFVWLINNRTQKRRICKQSTFVYLVWKTRWDEIRSDMFMLSQCLYFPSMRYLFWIISNENTCFDLPSTVDTHSIGCPKACNVRKMSYKQTHNIDFCLVFKKNPPHITCENADLKWRVLICVRWTCYKWFIQEKYANNTISWCQSLTKVYWETILDCCKQVLFRLLISRFLIKCSRSINI